MVENKLINIETDGDITIVSFTEPSICGPGTIENISGQLRSLAAKKQPKKLIIDFEGVKFFSSQMLGLLVDLWRKLEEYNGKMIISGINPQISRVFKITNLDRIFTFCPDRDSAVRSMRPD